MSTKKLESIAAVQRKPQISWENMLLPTTIIACVFIFLVVAILAAPFLTAFATGGDAGEAIQDGVKKGLGSVYTIITAIVVPVAAVCLAVCAFKIFTGGERGMQEAKMIAIYTVIGIAIVYLAPVIVEQVSSWFSSYSENTSIFN